MFQKFFTNTLMSNFIKNMLATTPIPLLPCVKDGDILLNSVKYIYKNFIIKCVTSGRLKMDTNELLYPSDNLYPSNILYPKTGESVAQFKVIEVYSPDNILYNYTYHSKFTHYDSDTHKNLGEYLRYLKNIKGLDLMPYYNCYNYNIVDNVHLHRENDVGATYSQTNKDGYKVLSIPIKFFTTYTVALECSTTVLCRCVIYGDAGMVVDNSPLNGYAGRGVVYYSDYLENSFQEINNTQFDKPFTINVSTNYPKLFDQQKNLYLLIQIPEDNESSVVVLEGDYRKEVDRTVIKASKVSQIVDNKIQSTISASKIIKYKKFDPNLSLLRFNSNNTFAFSDRLVEYLLLNVIHKDDEITQNVQRLREALISYYTLKNLRISEKIKLVGDNEELNAEIAKNNEKISKVGRTTGIWDDSLSELIKEFVDEHRDKYDLVDMDNNLNKDLEKVLVAEGVVY